MLASLIRLPLRLFLALSLAIALLLLWPTPLNQSRDSRCDVEQFITQAQELVTVQALRTYVNPFIGRHQVFGVFPVPKGLPKRTSILLKVQGVGVYCSRVLHYGPQYRDLTAPIGQTLMLDHIRTRTALRVFLTGNLDALRDSSHWEILYRSEDLTPPLRTQSRNSPAPNSSDESQKSHSSQLAIAQPNPQSP